MNRKAVMVGMCVLTASTAGLLAQEVADAWRFRLTPYAWAMGLEGDIGAGGVSTPIDVNFTDALSDLDLALMLALEARHGDWGFVADGSYLKLSDELSTAVGEVDVTVRQLTMNGLVMYRVLDVGGTTVELGAGSRYMRAKVEIDTAATDVDSVTDWADPLVAVRIRQQIAESLFGVLAGDIGGFGVSSDLTWQVTAAVGYAITTRAAVLLGYRYLDYDYDDGFSYDVAASGMAVGVQVNL